MAQFPGGIPLLVKNSSESYSDDIKEKLSKIKAELKVNLTKQEKLSSIFLEGLLAKEAYKSQAIPLRDDERDMKNKIKRLEFSIVEKERSEDYRTLLRNVVSHFDTIKVGLDIAGKRGLLRLVFKSRIVENNRLKDFSLYEPFQSLYEGAKIKCQNEINQRVTAITERSSTYVLSDAR